MTFFKKIGYPCKGLFTPSVSINLTIMLAILVSLKTMEKNPEEGSNPSWSDSIAVNENYTASVTHWRLV